MEEKPFQLEGILFQKIKDTFRQEKIPKHIGFRYESSFNWYVNEFYIKGFGLDKSKALLMDCSKIGLETTAEKRHGITGEVEDALTIEKMEDVWKVPVRLEGGGSHSLVLSWAD